MKGTFRTAAALAAMVSTTAQAAEPACFTRAEVSSLITYFVPVMMEPMLASCKPHLAPDAYLLVGGQRISDSLAARKADEWKVAKSAAIRVWGDGKMADLPDDALQAGLNAKVVQEISGKLTPQECRDISAISAKLAPMSPDNLVDLVTEIAVIALRDGRKAGVQICPVK